MKKILKSILIATASIGTITGSAATVVSCANSENQKKYDDALTTLKGHLGTGETTSLDNFLIPQGANDFSTLKGQIETKINAIINDDDFIKNILGASTVTITASSFNTTQVTSADNSLLANDIKLSVASDLSGVTLPDPFSISIKYKVIVDTSDQGKYEQEAKNVLYSLSTYSLTTPLTLHVSDDTIVKAKTVIATYVNSAITALFTWQRTKIGVISNFDVSIAGDVPSTGAITTASLHEIQITIPTIATQVLEKSFTYNFKIEVLANVSESQRRYDENFQKILSVVPPSTNSLLNWSATLPASGNTPPPASDHWLGGVGFETYNPGTFSAKFTTIDFPKFVTAAAPAFSKALQNAIPSLGQAKGFILFFGPDGQELNPHDQQINLAVAGTYYFILDMQYAGTDPEITTLHTIAYATTITIKPAS